MWRDLLRDFNLHKSVEHGRVSALHPLRTLYLQHRCGRNGQTGIMGSYIGQLSGSLEYPLVIVHVFVLAQL
jgi:hypothetical protein